MNADKLQNLRRTAVRTIATVALATPAVAIAAEPVAPASDTMPGLDRGPKAGAIEEQITDPLIALARAEERAEGPFHPVLLDSVDYGSVEAAFGNARGRPHEGQDIFAPAGTPVIAPADGVVLDGGYDGGRGNWLAVYDPERKLTYNYFHMIDAAEVAIGKKVEAGDRVGQVGCTGSCYGDHLHFEVREGQDPYATAIDPMPYLVKWKPFEK